MKVIFTHWRRCWFETNRKLCIPGEGWDAGLLMRLRTQVWWVGMKEKDMEVKREMMGWSRCPFWARKPTPNGSKWFWTKTITKPVQNRPSFRAKLMNRAKPDQNRTRPDHGNTSWRPCALILKRKFRARDFVSGRTFHKPYTLVRCLVIVPASIA